MQDRGEGEREKKERGVFGELRQKERRAVPCLVLDRTYGWWPSQSASPEDAISPSFYVIFRSGQDPLQIIDCYLRTEGAVMFE